MLKLWTNLTFLQTKTLDIFFTRFNDSLLFSRQNTVLVRHSKIVRNEIVMKEVQSRDWQYLVESMIQLVKDEKNHLKPLPKVKKDSKKYET